MRSPTGQPCQQGSSPLGCFGEPQQVASNHGKESLGKGVVAAAVAEEASVAARDHQPGAPGEHRQEHALLPEPPLRLPCHQKVAEFAVFVSLLGIEAAAAIEHQRPRALAQPSKIPEAGRQPHLPSGASGVMHLRGGDHQPRCCAPQQQGQKLLQQGLVAQVVHGDGEFKPLGRPAGLGFAAVLQAGVEHQCVDRLPSCQQGLGAELDAAQISQVADGGINRAAQTLAQDCGGAPIPAGQGEAVTGLKQQGRCLKTNPGAATGEQDVAAHSSAGLINRHGSCSRHHLILFPQLFSQLLAQRRHGRTRRPSCGDGLGMTLSVRS